MDVVLRSVLLWILRRDLDCMVWNELVYCRKSAELSRS